MLPDSAAQVNKLDEIISEIYDNPIHPFKNQCREILAPKDIYVKQINTRIINKFEIKEATYTIIYS